MGCGGGVTADLHDLLVARLSAHPIKSIAKVVDPKGKIVPLRRYRIPHRVRFAQFTVASQCLGKSEWVNSANPILMQIDRLRDLVPAHPESLIGHTGTFSAGQL